MKRILTIQDISCLGKCSLTAALPVLSVMGLETVVLPTAILSAHTEFKGVYAKDLTEMLRPVTAHWKSQGITFDSMSCGYLGSVKQMELVKGIFEDFRRTDTLTVIDPVMGDYGRLYSGFDMDYVGHMKEFIQEADILLPNLTEAAYLLDMDYSRLPKDREGYEQMAVQLSELSQATVVLKGISLEPGTIGVMAYDRSEKAIVFCEREMLDARLSGTGDIFAAVCQGAFTKGKSLKEAVGLAMDFVLECMRKTLEDEGHRWYGVNFEEALPVLLKPQC